MDEARIRELFEAIDKDGDGRLSQVRIEVLHLLANHLVRRPD